MICIIERRNPRNEIIWRNVCGGYYVMILFGLNLGRWTNLDDPGVNRFAIELSKGQVDSTDAIPTFESMSRVKRLKVWILTQQILQDLDVITVGLALWESNFWC